MKTSSLSKMIRWTGTALATVTLIGLAVQSSFGEIPSGKGAAAKLTKPHSSTSWSSTQKASSCPLCVNTLSTHADSTARGFSKPTVISSQHGCGSCKTTIATAGHGKASHTVATHSCAADEKPTSCCN